MLLLAVIAVDSARCGCGECTAEVLDAMAGEHTCGDRISFLMEAHKFQEKDACTRVAGLEFATDCGACNPQKCDGKGKVAPLLDDGFTEKTLFARSPLYCFPPFKERTRFRNVWGRYTVEVKESDSTCGPSDNKFTTNTVSLVDKRHIKLQFKKVGSQWEASEVRVRLPEREMPFSYGSFSFSLKTIEVINSITGKVLANVLPPSLVLGLFTWDDTESYAAKENMNHEVDIEISRWNDPDNADLQFLVSDSLFINVSAHFVA